MPQATISKPGQIRIPTCYRRHQRASEKRLFDSATWEYGGAPCGLSQNESILAD